MWYSVLADLLVLLHLGFILFVVFGGLLALKWRWAVWLHVPAATWGAAVEFMGWICPLTPWEHWLRTHEAGSPYDADFVARYLLPILYPVDLTREVQIALGSIVLLMNVAIYGLLWRKKPNIE